MSHYAKVVNGKVTQVIVAESSFFDKFVDSSPGEWIQTSYNTRGNVHYGPDGNPDNGVALRGNFASINFNYDRAHDVFYAPQPFPSWTIGTETNWIWTAPVDYPTDGKSYYWNEATINWIGGTTPTANT